MARIENQQVYPLKLNPVSTDSFPITDSEDSNKTKTVLIGSLQGAIGATIYTDSNVIPESRQVTYNDLLDFTGSNTNSEFIAQHTSGAIFRVNEDGVFSTSLGVGTLIQEGSAVLQVDSTTQGFLRPRMTTVQRNAITSPAIGLSIYNLDTESNEYYTGVSWISAGVGNIYSNNGAIPDSTVRNVQIGQNSILNFTGAENGTGIQIDDANELVRLISNADIYAEGSFQVRNGNTFQMYQSGNTVAATLGISGLTASRIFQFPDEDGTLALVSDISTLYNSDGTITDSNRTVTLDDTNDSGNVLTFQVQGTAGQFSRSLYTYNGVSSTYSSDGALIRSVNLNALGMIVTDTIGTKGLEYAADYSANYTDRSLPDKAYVDSLVGATLYTSDGDFDGVTRIGTGLNNSSLSFEMYDITPVNWNTRSRLALASTSSFFGFETGNGAGVTTGAMTLSFDSSAMSVLDTINNRGLQYDSDYSANYVDRSIPDKAYVDSITFLNQITSPVNPYFGNKLTPKSGNDEGFYVSSVNNNSVGYLTNATGNGSDVISEFRAITNDDAFATGPNAAGISIVAFGSNHSATWLQNASAVYGGYNNLHILTPTNTSDIIFSLGNTGTNSPVEADQDVVFTINKDKTILAPLLTNAIIDAATDDVITTKGWVVANGGSNIYSADGTLPADTDRTVTVPTDSKLEFVRGTTIVQVGDDGLDPIGFRALSSYAELISQDSNSHMRVLNGNPLEVFASDGLNLQIGIGGTLPTWVPGYILTAGATAGEASWQPDTGGGSSEWSTFTGTRAGADLLVTLGDYDDSGNSTKLIIDDDSGRITIASEATIQGTIFGEAEIVLYDNDLSRQVNINTATQTTGARTLSIPDLGAIDRTMALSVNGIFADTTGNVTIENLLLLSSTITVSRNSLLSDADGLNESTASSDVTITIDTNTNVPYPIGTILLYKQNGSGNILIRYAGGVTGTDGQTYTLNQTVSVWKTGTDTWELLNPPQSISYDGYALSASSGIPSNSNRVEVDRTVGTKVYKSVRASLNTADTTTVVTVDVKRNGVSIFDTLLTIDATELTSETATTPFSFLAGASEIIFLDDDEVSYDVSGVTDATGLKIKLIE